MPKRIAPARFIIGAHRSEHNKRRVLMKAQLKVQALVQTLHVAIVVVVELRLQMILNDLGALNQLVFPERQFAQVLLVLIVPVDQAAQVGVEREPALFELMAERRSSIDALFALPQIPRNPGRSC